MKKFLIILIFILSNCGYQPLHTNKNTEKLIFQNLNLTGNKKINRKIVSVLDFSKSQSNYTFDELSLDSKKSIEATSKDNKGKTISYKTTIETLFVIKNKNEEVKRKSFKVDFSYNERDNKFDLVEYQNQIENNLIDKIIEELIIYINL